MNEKEKKQLLKIIRSIRYGKIEVNKKDGKIINVKKIESIKL